MKLSFPWRMHHRKRCSANLIVLFIIGLCFGLSVSSWRYNSIYANGALSNRRSSNQQTALLGSSNPSADSNQIGRKDASDRNSDSAKFTLSGSICGQSREYLLENLHCGDDCEIQFCGEQAIDELNTDLQLLLERTDELLFTF
jgi:hypothetical protein